MLSRNKPFVIAEMACSHEGSTEHAQTIIDGAGSAGADAIQFQIWKVEEMVVPNHPDWDVLKRIELSRDEWLGLAEYSRERYPDMEIIACVYEEPSTAFAADELHANAFKLHSSDLSNPTLVRAVAQREKRIDLSVGASTIAEITAALRWIEEVDAGLDVWMMYGYQNFPTPTDKIRLAFMRQLQDLFGRPVGYQDHSDGDDPAAFWLPAAAFGMGVRILEKHITHDRSFQGIDHEAALNPDEFAEFMRMVHTLNEAEGTPGPATFSDEEIRYRKYSKKSLVAARDLTEGDVVEAGDLRAMRAADLGMPPSSEPGLVGRTIRRAVAEFDLVAAEDFQ